MARRFSPALQETAAMPRFAANLSFLFAELPFLDRFDAAAAAGFRAVEFMFPYEWPADDIAARLSANGLRNVLFNVAQGAWDKGERGIAALPDRSEEFAAAIDTALRYAEKLGCSQLHVMAGLTNHGANREAFVRNLASAADTAAASGVTLLIEPINTRDMPSYFLTSAEEARQLIGEVGKANVGLQLDLYHRQIMQKDAAAAVARFADITRHIQIASPPDRGEPDAGELDYAAIFRAIDAGGYAGWIGCEYKPRASTAEGLDWFRKCGVAIG
jgi:hydroxypyruvate isomerase